MQRELAPKKQRPGRKIGYARVSKNNDKQTTETQVIPLREAGCEIVFEEAASGACPTRRELAAMMKALQPGDTLVVVRLDRFSRSLSHLIMLIDELESRDIGIKVLDCPIDTRTPSGRLLVHVIGAISEYERSMMIARTKAGMKRALALGHKSGPKFKMSTTQKKYAIKHVMSGAKSQAECARLFGVSRNTVSRFMLRHMKGVSGY